MRGMPIYPFNKQNPTQTKRANSKLVKYLFSCFVLLALIMDTVNSCGPGRGPRSHQRHKLKTLVYGEHIPNVSENSPSASGPLEERIRSNDSKLFRTLETNYNPAIEFLDLEGTGVSRFMTRKLKDKLNILAVSVANHWMGVKVAVRRGWVDGSDQGDLGLHYEGRAVDIQTHDKNRSRMGILAGLAVKAGFDWVHYEKKGYIHCSVKSDKASAGNSAGCFTGDSMVQTRSGPKALSKVELGEELLSMDPTTGSLEYSPLMLFLDRQPETKHLYVHIKLSSGKKIVLTPSHLIMRWERIGTDLTNFTSLFSYNAVPTFAKNIARNDRLIINVNNRIRLDHVDSVKYDYEEGMYAPLTEMGTIVVNDVVASCYAVLEDQDLAHVAFMPYRLVYNINRSFNRFYTAVTSLVSASGSRTNPTHTPSQIGIHWYAKFLRSIADYVVPASMMYEH